MGAHRIMAFTDEALFDACGVRLMFTGRHGGVSDGPFASLNTASHVGDRPEAVEANRRLVCEAAGADAGRLIVLNQVHGTSLVRMHDAAGLGAARARADAGADGAVVRAQGVPTLLNSADCLLLVVVSPSGSFAVAHAGWRGAAAGIAGKAARALAEGDEFPVSAFNAYLGPHIRSECFEVGQDVAVRFAGAFGEDVLAGGRHVSLARAVSLDLERAGLDARRIADAGVCTKCNSGEYFSYRASNGDCGRQAAFVVGKGRV